MGFLISFQVLIFFFLQILSKIDSLSGAFVLKNTALPLQPFEIFSRPWTILTYMLVHTDFFHLIFNILGLAIFGFWLSNSMGKGALIPLFLLGGLVGGFLVLLAVHLPGLSALFQKSFLLGASAGVMAIVLASTLFMPEHVVHLYFLFPVKMKYLGLGMVALDVLSLLFSQNVGGHLSHLGGALVGFLFIQTLPGRGSRKLVSLSDILKTTQSVLSDRHVNYGRPLNDDEYNEMRVNQEEHLDKILDKINSQGMASLTNAERKFLEEFSKKYNDLKS